MNQEKKLIIFLLSLFAIGAGYLFFTSERYQDPGYQKNWWVIYFEDMQNQNANFVIENYGEQTNFHWEAAIKNKKLQEGTNRIPKNEKQIIFPENIEAREGSKMTITVYAGEEKKEIYKYLKK